MALAKGAVAETIPWCFTEKSAIAPHGSEKVPVLLDGDRPVVNSWAIAQPSRRQLSGPPSLFGGEGGRAMARMLNWWGDGGGRRHLSADRRRHPAQPESGGRGLFPQIARGAVRQAAGRGHGEPRQGGRRVPQVAQSNAADFRTGLSRRRRCELRGLYRVRRVPMGAGGQPVQAAERGRSGLRVAGKTARRVRRAGAEVARLSPASVNGPASTAGRRSIHALMPLFEIVARQPARRIARARPEAFADSHVQSARDRGDDAADRERRMPDDTSRQFARGRQQASAALPR